MGPKTKTLGLVLVLVILVIMTLGRVILLMDRVLWFEIVNLTLGVGESITTSLSLSTMIA